MPRRASGVASGVEERATGTAADAAIARIAAADEKPARRVIVALELDRSESTKIGVAAAQARALGATLVLLHVTAGADVAAEARARAEIATVARGLRAGGIAAEIVFRRGAVAAAIVAEIERADTVLAVLGSSIRRTLVRPALGGIADRVVGAVSRPVLIIRSSDSKASAAA
jgi:nucleotide-binding universal stress UspA family protein